MAMHAGCRCSGTEAEGGYSIQSYSLLCEGDNSGWGVSSLNPEAMHLISSASETCIQYQLIREDLCVEWSNNWWLLLFGNLFSHRSSNSLLEGPESTLMWIICCNCSAFYCLPSCIKLSYICREFGKSVNWQQCQSWDFVYFDWSNPLRPSKHLSFPVTHIQIKCRLNSFKHAHSFQNKTPCADFRS